MSAIHFRMADLMQRLDWALVRSFLAVMDAGSVSAAARATQGHQPTLSRHLTELEGQLGVALFERTGRGVRPTAAGLEVLPAARQMQAAAEALARSVTRGREATRGTVRITVSQVVATWLLPPLVAEFHRAEPEIAIEIVSSNAVQNLLRREADIAVRMVRPDQGSLIARKVGEVALGAWASADYLAAMGTPRTPATWRTIAWSATTRTTPSSAASPAWASPRRPPTSRCAPTTRSPTAS